MRVCILALVLQHTNPIFSAPVVLYLRPFWLYRFTPQFLTNGTTGWKRLFTQKDYVVIFSTNIILNICHSKNNSAHNIKDSPKFSCKVPVIIVRIQSHLHFLNGISKHTQISNFVKIHPSVANLFHAGRQTLRSQ